MRGGEEGKEGKEGRGRREKRRRGGGGGKEEEVYPWLNIGMDVFVVTAMRRYKVIKKSFSRSMVMGKDTALNGSNKPPAPIYCSIK